MENEILLWVWMIGIICLAVAALVSNQRYPYHTARYFGWLAVISVWVMVPVFMLAS